MPFRAQYFPVFLLLATVVLACFGSTIFNYFQSDDFILLAKDSFWLDKISSAWSSTFTQSWLANTHHSLYYRPLHPVTYLIELLFCREKPMVYHVVNLTLMTIAAFIVFVLAKNLYSRVLPDKSNDAAVIAACIFAAYPLHTESVAWISGRIDLICAIFIWTSLYIFFAAPLTKSRLVLSIGAYICAQLLKESAAVVPPLVMSGLILLDEGLVSQKWWHIHWPTWRRAARLSSPFWVTLALFTILRKSILGSWIGGYTGSFAVLEKASLQYWLGNAEGWSRLIFPIPAHPDFFHKIAWSILLSLYLVIIATTFLTRKKISRPLANLMILMLVWTTIAILPALNTWYLTDCLIGGRLFFTGSTSLCLFLALLIYRCPFAKIISAAFVAVFITSSMLLCHKWHGGALTSEAIKLTLERKIDQLAKGQRLVILNPPRSSNGIYLYPHYWDLKNTLVPPFCNTDKSEKLVSIDHFMYGSPLINAALMRRLIEDDAAYSFCYWDEKKQNIVDYNCNQWQKAVALIPMQIKQVEKSKLAKGLLQYKAKITMPLPAAVVDSVDVALSLPANKSLYQAKSQAQPTISLCWSANTDETITIPLELDDQLHIYSFPVSQYKTWMILPQIKSLDFIINAADGFEPSIESVLLNNAKKSKPILRPDQKSLTLRSDGSYSLKDQSTDYILDFDCTSIAGSAKSRLEISRPDCWFDIKPRDFRDTAYGTDLGDEKILAKKEGRIFLPKSTFLPDRYYELRLAALDQNGNVCGYFSDPVSIYVGK